MLCPPVTATMSCPLVKYFGFFVALCLHLPHRHVRLRETGCTVYSLKRRNYQGTLFRMVSSMSMILRMGLPPATLASHQALSQQPNKFNLDLCVHGNCLCAHRASRFPT